MAAGALTTIYALKDPRTAEIRYVGKTDNLRARIRCHRWEARNGSFSTHKVRWLRGLGMVPIVEVLEMVPWSSWAERERWWIQRFRRAGYRLTNISDGGDTSPVAGRHHTAETKAKLRALALARGQRPPSQLGVRASAETRARLSASNLARGARPPAVGGWNKGLKMSAEVVAKNRATHIGVPWSAARRAAQLARTQ